MLFLGDSLEIIKKWDDNSVDHVFTSPPYNIGLNRDINSKYFAKYEHFNDLNKNYLNWSIEVVEELMRITKTYIFWNIQANARNKKHVYKFIGHFADHIQQNFIWYKNNATPSSAQYYVTNSVEYVICISNKTVKSNINHFHTNLIDIPKGTPEIKGFNAIMPQKLADYFILNFTKESETILDPFMGSGTTGVSCINGQRKFIGIELIPEYLQIAEKRLSEIR